jgi:hypothetical protein
MNPARFTVLIVSLTLLVSARAEQKPLSGAWVDYGSMRQFKLPVAGDIPSLLGAFEYLENELPRVFVFDFNGDHVEDYLVQSSERLCGTGGCLYSLVDGKTKKRMGDFFGSPILILDQKINRYPVIQSYGHLSADSGNFATYVFDGKKYQIVATVYVEGKSLEELFKGLSAFKKMKAAASKTGS